MYTKKVEEKQFWAENGYAYYEFEWMCYGIRMIIITAYSYYLL